MNDTISPFTGRFSNGFHLFTRNGPGVEEKKTGQVALFILTLSTGNRFVLGYPQITRKGVDFTKTLLLSVFFGPNQVTRLSSSNIFDS